MEYNLLIFASLFIIIVESLYSSRSAPVSWSNNEEYFDNDQEFEASERQDQEEAPSNEHSHGRVQIKVYRGPDTENEHEHFAPYGFWVKQPADSHR